MRARGNKISISKLVIAVQLMNPYQLVMLKSILEVYMCMFSILLILVHFTLPVLCVFLLTDFIQNGKVI